LGERLNSEEPIKVIKKLGRQVETSSLEGARILIADDELSTRDIIFQSLTEEYHKCTVACDGSDALTKLNACPNKVSALQRMLVSSFKDQLFSLELLLWSKSTRLKRKVGWGSWLPFGVTSSLGLELLSEAKPTYFERPIAEA